MEQREIVDHPGPHHLQNIHRELRKLDEMKSQKVKQGGSSDLELRGSELN